MAKVTAFHAKDEARVDPLRAALAAALKEAERAHQAVDRQRGGIGRARAAERAAETAVTAAEEAVKTAQQDHAAALANAAADDAPAPASGVRAARRAATDAADELGAVKGAMAELKANLPGLIEAARAADVAVEVAISAILAPVARQLLVRAQAVQRLFMPLRSALFALFESVPAGMDESLAFERARRPLAGVRADVAKFFETLEAVDRQVDPWREARELLRANAYAELPFIAPPSATSDETAHQAPRAS